MVIVKEEFRGWTCRGMRFIDNEDFEATTKIRSRELIHTVHISHKIEKETFFLHIGQYGYQKTQNFMLIPNLKTKLRKSALIKSYF